MRPIKFRVRDRQTKKFVGYEELMPDITNDGWRWAMSYGGTDWEDGVYDADYYLREQFTGLLDKNGREIYDGDVLDVTGRLDDYEIYGRVEWDDDEARWMFVRYDGDDIEHSELFCWDKHHAIIGNVFENPDLLR